MGSLQFSLKSVPENLIYVKMKRMENSKFYSITFVDKKHFFASVVRQMSKMLKRRTSVNHLYQAATMVVNSSNTLYDKMVEASVNLKLH